MNSIRVTEVILVLTANEAKGLVEALECQVPEIDEHCSAVDKAQRWLIGELINQLSCLLWQ